MDFSAILRKSASSSATETEKCSSNESLLQAIDSELKRIGHVEETPSEFTFELNRDFNKGGRAYVVLTKEFQGELIRVASGYFFVPHFDFEDFNVTISKHGRSALAFNCSYTPDGISIWHITVDDGDQYLRRLNLDVDENVDENENLKKAFQKYLEVRGIKPSNIEFIFKCISNKYTQINLTVLKKIKNFILFSVPKKKSASSLAPTASRLAQANRNCHSDVFSASSHLNQKPTLGSSASETKMCCSNKYSLLRLAIDSEIKCADYYGHVEESRSKFTLKIEDSAPVHRVVLTREYRGELVEVSSYIQDFTIGKCDEKLCVTISNNSGSFLKFDCFGTSDAISIRRIGIIKSIYSKDKWPYNDGDDVVEFDNMDEGSYMDENLKKAFFEYLETRGIKPSIVDFMIKCYRYKKAKKNVDGVAED